MNSLSSEEKKPRYFPWLTLTIVIVTVGILAFIASFDYCDYTERSRWSKAITQITDLKIAIGECLNGTAGNVAACNDLSSDKLGKYHAVIPAKTDDIQSISVLKNAGIRIAGSTGLEMCILTIVPSIDKTKQIILWKPTMQASSGGDTVEKCRTYVKDSN